MIRLLLISLIVSACTLLNREPTSPVEPAVPAEEQREEETVPAPRKPTPPKPVKPATPKIEAVKSMCGPLSEDERERVIQALDCLLEADKPKGE